MAKVWVLDTETKGTGAHMVPLERVVEERRSGAGEPRFAFERAEPGAAAPEAQRPLEFRVVDVLSHEVIADRVGLRETVGALEGARSVADVTVSVWDPERAAWRMLTIGETKALWAYRHAAGRPS